MVHKVLDQSGAPPRLWCFAVDYTMDIWNHLANRALEWRTPIEKLNGHTPDISKVKFFGFYDHIKYLDSDVKFPGSRTLTGKFLGFEPEKGDTLVYRILPDHVTKGEATHFLIRSVVEPDSIPNFRTGLMRNLPPQMEPFDEPPKPPRRGSRLSQDKDTEPLLSLRR